MTFALYSGPRRLRVSLMPFRNVALPSPMIATKCAPLVEFATPRLRSVAKAASASCIFPESSCRMSLRLTPCLHIKLPTEDWGPPFASIRPIWAFHAQTSMRTSGRSAHPGFELRLARLAFDAPPGLTELAAGRSALGGTIDSLTLAGGASVLMRPEPDRCHNLQ